MDDEKKPDPRKYRTNFLWPPDEGSIEEAGYEFANGNTPEYQQQWWEILVERVSARQKRKDGELRLEAPGDVHTHIALAISAAKTLLAGEAESERSFLNGIIGHLISAKSLLQPCKTSPTSSKSLKTSKPGSSPPKPKRKTAR
jgi:hypothetical protein